MMVEMFGRGSRATTSSALDLAQIVETKSMKRVFGYDL